MTHRFSLVLAMALAVCAAACRDSLSSSSRSVLLANTSLAGAFATVPVGYTSAQTTYDASAEGAGPFFPGGPMDGLGHGPGPGLGGGMGPMIGGGLGMDFLGGPGLGHDFGHGPRGDPDLDDSSCAYSASTGRVTCAPVTDRGLTITRSSSYTDASGAPQSAFDSLTTNAINTQVSVSGTITRRDSSTTTINDASDRTVSGLAKGSTQHVVNGTAAGSELSTGRDNAGTFTALRASADTIRGVTIPVSDVGHLYPTAGTIIRVMSVTLTPAGGMATTSTRREVVTYNGTSTAQMVITQDGTTKTCSLPMPFGRPTCQ